MAICPVCEELIEADDAALQFHVNAHFDNGQSNGAGRKGMSGWEEEKSVFEQGDTGLKRPAETGEARECPICDYPLDLLTEVQAQTHVMGCLDEQKMPPQPSDNAGSHELYQEETWGEGTMQANAQRDDDEWVSPEWDGPARPGGWNPDWVSKAPQMGDKWWDPLEGSLDSNSIPNNFTPGAMPALRRLLIESSHSSTLKARLSCDITHIRHSIRFDAGWGCGYRNALMAISALIVSDPSYRAVFARGANGAEPGVRRVQGWIEEAWNAGYDREGCGQLKGKVLGTRKWIGTTDLYAMFSHMGVPCRLYDFPKSDKTNSSARHPSQVLIDWVKRYFDEEPANHHSTPLDSNGDRSAFDVLMRPETNGAGLGEVVRQTKKLPLILQHSGHSRTIVGYEETSRGTNLLLFDPGRFLPKDITTSGLRHIQQSRGNSLPIPPRKPSHACSHESIKFTRPYTNGASEPIYTPPEEIDARLEPDEEMTAGGWVRRKVTKVAKKAKGYGAGTNEKDDEVERKKGVPQLLSNFRVTEERLAKFREYQILVFTGGPVLSGQERAGRKVITSTPVRK